MELTPRTILQVVGTLALVLALLYWTMLDVLVLSYFTGTLLSIGGVVALVVMWGTPSYILWRRGIGGIWHAWALCLGLAALFFGTCMILIGL